jgi:hypothetical protein
MNSTQAGVDFRLIVSLLEDQLTVKEQSRCFDAMSIYKDVDVEFVTLVSDYLVLVADISRLLNQSAD